LVCPEKGRPRVLPPAEGPRVRSGPSLICKEIAGQCLAVEPNDPMNTSFQRHGQRLLQLDLYSGAWKAVAQVSSPLQWLGDSVVFAGAELRPAHGWRGDRWRVVRYWPKDGRSEVLFSLPGHGLERQEIPSPARG
jgi:hypothetical protein